MIKSTAHSIIIGTAGFGTRYGVANEVITSTLEDIKNCVEFAQSNEIHSFDSAPSYGNAESLLGNYRNLTKPLNLVSKIKSEKLLSFNLAIESVKKTLADAKIDKLWCLLLHEEIEFVSSRTDKIIRNLNKVKELGFTEHIGISTYSANAAIFAKKFYPTLTVFQIPENLFDRRFFRSNELQKFQESGNILHVRSIFLQGLLIMDSKKLPIKLARMQKNLKQFDEICEKYSIRRIHACLSYAYSIPWSSGVVIGVNSKTQLQEILQYNQKLEIPWEKELQPVDPWMLDPRNWS
jgi:aryl-alcohol dehydrogenase-like predicted oxidoreductase